MPSIAIIQQSTSPREYTATQIRLHKFDIKHDAKIDENFYKEFKFGDPIVDYYKCLEFYVKDLQQYITPYFYCNLLGSVYDFVEENDEYCLRPVDPDTGEFTDFKENSFLILTTDQFNNFNEIKQYVKSFQWQLTTLDLFVIY